MNPIASKYHSELWFREIQEYMKLRYPSIVNRIAFTQRYVDISPQNKDAFSYEYASILRDIGSIFSSTLDKLLTFHYGKKKKYGINAFREYIIDEIEDIEKIQLQMSGNFNGVFLFPLSGLSGENHSLKWWTAYNHLKHSDIDCLDEGSLSNVIYGFGALTLLYLSILGRTSYHLDELTANIFHYVGFSDENFEEDYFFPKAMKPALSSYKFQYDDETGLDFNVYREKNLFSLEKKLGFYFKEKILLISALTSKSYRKEASEKGDILELEDDEKLAFLGDAVLELVAREKHYQTGNDLTGVLSVKTDSVVDNNSLYEKAIELDLKRFLRLGHGEAVDQEGEEKILSRALEALIGSLYLDHGLDAAKQMILINLLEP